MYIIIKVILYGRHMMKIKLFTEKTTKIGDVKSYACVAVRKELKRNTQLLKKKSKKIKVIKILRIY